MTVPCIQPVVERVPLPEGLTGRGVTVAFVDSGFHPHPDLTQPENRILCHVDVSAPVPRETDRFHRPLLTSWHGMMTSAIGLGNGFLSNGLYRGIAPGAHAVLVRAGRLLPDGRLRVAEADIARGLNWVGENAARFGIRVVNVSVGGDHPTDGTPRWVDEVVEHLVGHNITVVVAGGNTGRRELVPPASAASAITVGGVDDHGGNNGADRRMYPTSWGRGVHGAPKPDVLAPANWLPAPLLPGSALHTTAGQLWQRLQETDGDVVAAAGLRTRLEARKVIHPHYQHAEGTSMAAPIVAGTVALLLEAEPDLTPAEVRRILVSTAEPMPGVSWRQQGGGVLRPDRAVNFLRS